MTIQIVRLVNNFFNLELDFKKAGKTNNRTPIIYTVGISLSIIQDYRTSNQVSRWWNECDCDVSAIRLGAMSY